MRFAPDQLSEPLHTASRPEVAVFEVDLRNVRTGWVIAPRDRPLEDVVDEINTRAARRSYGVLCADLMLGLDVVPGDLPNAVDGRAVAERAVGASLVVVAHPVWQRGPTGLA